MQKNYHYFVEGQDEQRLLQVLKTDLEYIKPGKVQVFNVVQEKLTPFHLMQLKNDTVAVLIFDTDSGNPGILQQNISSLKKNPAVCDIYFIPQVNNLEDEFLRSCNISCVKELTGSKSNSDYKHDLLRDAHFSDKLLKHGFNFHKFWNKTASGIYRHIPNDADKIRLKKGLPHQ